MPFRAAPRVPPGFGITVGVTLGFNESQEFIPRFGDAFLVGHEIAKASRSTEKTMPLVERGEGNYGS